MEYSIISTDINSTLRMVGATVGLPLPTSDASLSINTEGKGQVEFELELTCYVSLVLCISAPAPLCKCKNATNFNGLGWLSITINMKGFAIYCVFSVVVDT